MNEFAALRKRARDKRDKAIAIVRREYELALTQIATLEQDLLGLESSRHQKISACIERVIPRDEPFNSVDIMAALEALDPTRPWRMHSIHNHIARLRERGIIRRIKRSTIHEPASYVRYEVPVPENASSVLDMSMSQVIDLVLTRPMTSTEVVVAVREAGYVSTMTKTGFRNHVVDLLNRGKYRQDGGKWLRG
ncbi:hypothetical protein ETAA8_69490 [Anatilimnocola aggregata]|uniref:Uncharacterized protein n=1 Tax=Anatilimnocola aggregata TaxID=2528021 RepID=A0A517YNJ5_9BACT|nr:hypothetical protein [Anatilimnocola aggregata]QDU31789.1 hypothetical protein ETAA8_69490 [Anatilimnocola aggregata]